MKDLEETFMHLKTEKQLQSVKLQLMENNLQAISSLVDPKPKKVTNEINIQLAKSGKIRAVEGLYHQVEAAEGG